MEYDFSLIIERVAEIMGVITEFGRCRYKAGYADSMDLPELYEKYLKDCKEQFTKVVTLIYDLAYDRERRREDDKHDR